MKAAFLLTIVLAMALTVLATSVLVYTLITRSGGSASLETDASNIDAMAATIADLDPPAGYRAELGASLMSFTAVGYTAGDNHSHLYLIQSDSEADGEGLTSALENLAPGAGDLRARMTVLETRSITVRGEETTLILSEGTNSEGITYRQAMVSFQGKGGPALLVLSEPIDRWNQQAAEAFITSIR